MLSPDEMKKKYSYHTVTPMMQQYLDVKIAHPDCLILFRLGDFYELFFDDAIAAAKILGIAIAKRGKIENEYIPMCGVPHHALDAYLNKLIQADYKIAICEQLETPEEAKKRGHKAVVRRDVVRIITPGTIIEEGIINSNEPNYLAALSYKNNLCAICYIDINTLEFELDPSAKVFAIVVCRRFLELFQPTQNQPPLASSPPGACRIGRGPTYCHSFRQGSSSISDQSLRFLYALLTYTVCE